MIYTTNFTIKNWKFITNNKFSHNLFKFNYAQNLGEERNCLVAFMVGWVSGIQVKARRNNFHKECHMLRIIHLNKEYAGIPFGFYPIF